MLARKTFWIYALLVVYSLAPMILVFASIGIANMQGCTLNEGSVSACKFFGQDIGEMLYTGFVMGWFSFITLPTGFLAIVAFTIYTVLTRKSKTVNQSSATPERH